jgi:hypothetical protein
MTTETLEKIGLENGDLTKLTRLINIETTAWIKQSKDGKYFNVAGLGGGAGNEPQSLDKNEIARRMKAIKAGSSYQLETKTTPTQTQAQSIEDPFADIPF